jgi:hypothetical protein
MGWSRATKSFLRPTRPLPRRSGLKYLVPLAIAAALDESEHRRETPRGSKGRCSLIGASRLAPGSTPPRDGQEQSAHHRKHAGRVASAFDDGSTAPAGAQRRARLPVRGHMPRLTRSFRRSGQQAMYLADPNETDAAQPRRRRPDRGSWSRASADHPVRCDLRRRPPPGAAAPQRPPRPLPRTRPSRCHEPAARLLRLERGLVTG